MFASRKTGVGILRAHLAAEFIWIRNVLDFSARYVLDSGQSTGPVDLAVRGVDEVAYHLGTADSPARRELVELPVDLGVDADLETLVEHAAYCTKGFVRTNMYVYQAYPPRYRWSKGVTEAQLVMAFRAATGYENLATTVDDRGARPAVLFSARCEGIHTQRVKAATAPLAEPGLPSTYQRRGE
jgi:hypothetical protein